MSDYKPGSIKGMGKEFSPTYRMGAKAKRLNIDERNQQSADVLARINARLGKPSPVPLRIVVDKNLQVHAQ